MTAPQRGQASASPRHTAVWHTGRYALPCIAPFLPMQHCAALLLSAYLGAFPLSPPKDGGGTHQGTMHMY